MNRMFLIPLAAAVVLATACERHPASELAGEHESGATGQTEMPHGNPDRAAMPMTPEGVPHNPAGANPVAAMDEHTKAEKAPAMNASEGPSPKTSEGTATVPASTEPAPKFFPGTN